jgi:hypothetical protein
MLLPVKLEAPLIDLLTVIVVYVTLNICVSKINSGTIISVKSAYVSVVNLTKAECAEEASDC